MHIVSIFRGIAGVALSLAIVAAVQAQYSGGSGTAEDPYQIATAADLIALGETPEDYDKHFILTADIDLDPNLPGRKVFDRAVIAPVIQDAESRWQGTLFTGVFDGDGHTISHLTIAGKGYRTGYLGLFGQLDSGAALLNLGLEAVDVNGADHDVGGLVGHNGGGIVNCHSAGAVSGSRYHHEVGGLVAHNTGSIAASYNTATVRGGEQVGGLVGCNGGSITVSYNSGSVIGECESYCYYGVGGLVGYNVGSIAMSYSSGRVVTRGINTGGLVGRNAPGWWDSGAVIHCFWDKVSSGHTTSAAGIGLTTAEMHDVNTFVSAGWDFVDEITNGTCDYWEISPGDYPRLRYTAGDGPVMPEGLGTAGQPYVIRDVRDLGTVWFEALAHYRLEAPLDLSAIRWSMAVVPCFAGTFDGNDLAVSNLHINGGGYLGLFGQIGSEAEVKYLGVVDVNIAGSRDHIGALAGCSFGTLTSCYANGTIGGKDCVGGLVGDNNGYIAVSSSAAAVNGLHTVGGFAGHNHGTVVDCHSEGSVAGDYSDIGGLVGWNTGEIHRSHSNAPVNGSSSVGGLVGENDGADSIMFASYSIFASYSTGTVSGSFCVGGLVGMNTGSNWLDMFFWPATISNSYSTSTVDGGRWVGGLVGSNGSDEEYVGGPGKVIDCYSTGSVTGDENVGGLVGRSLFWPSSELIRCFWDIETSGLTNMCDSEGISDRGCDDSHGLTTAEMQTASTFLEAGWDFIDETENGTDDIWWILEGQDYPRLWWEPRN